MQVTKSAQIAPKVSEWKCSRPVLVPDGDHFPLYDGRVELLHAADVSRPLELLWVDEKDWLLHPRKDLIV